MAKVFFVTGSSRGLGRDIVEAALAAGHQVLATARNPESLADLSARYGEHIRPVALDVTDFTAAQAAVNTAINVFGHIDVVVNNAGYANLVTIEDIDLADFRQQLDTNLMGVVNVTKAALPVLREQGFGRFIQISSVGGRVASAGLSAYQAAKWAVGGFSEVLAQEVTPFGIKVTVLEPGGMRTDWGGLSMTIPPMSAPYQATLGPMLSTLRSPDHKPAGDPEKVAQVVLQVADMAEPPLRLLVGSDAYRYGTSAWQARLESDARWRDLSVSTDHDDATAAELDPLGTLTNV